MYPVTIGQVIDLLEAGSLDPQPGGAILSTHEEAPALYEINEVAPLCAAGGDRLVCVDGSGADEQIALDCNGNQRGPADRS